MSVLTPVPHPLQPRLALQVRAERNCSSTQYSVGAAGLVALAGVAGHCQQKERNIFRSHSRLPSAIVRLAQAVSEVVPHHGSAVRDRRRNAPVCFEELGRPVADGNRLGVMLYLPDLDFGRKLASPQYESLAAHFELWCCTLAAGEDQTGLAQLEETVAAWLEVQLERHEQVILLGDGFGSLLALKLAFRFGRRLKGLVLVNPSTYYTETAMQNLSRVVRNSPAGVAATTGTLEGLLPASQDDDAGGATASGELLTGAIVKSFGLRSVVAALHNRVLAFRLRTWLRPAWEQVECELRRPSERSPFPPTLLAFSGSDPFRSIKNEALILKPLLEARCGPKRLQVKELEGVGLEPLSNGGLDFAAIIRDSPVCKPPRDGVKDFTFPSLSEVEEGSAQVERLASVISPVFCSVSREDASKRVFGLSGVPIPADLNGRPVLLVGNHQLYGIDLGPIVREFLIDRGVVARGLAFPGAMRRRGGGSDDDGIGGTFQTFGAVAVSAKNIFKLLQQGEMVLLFPGGIREALHGPGEEYQLQWPQRTDFVRVAARFNAVVVPFAGIGADDNLKVWSTSKTLREQAREILQKVLPFSMPEPEDEKSASIEEGLMPVSESLAQRPDFPILAPPNRLATVTEPGFGDRCYFSFGEPFDLKGLDPKDRDACSETYEQIREAVRRELAWLLAARQQDPYRDIIRRQLWERAASLDPSLSRKIPAGPLEGKLVSSYGRRAPSFPIQELAMP